MFLKVYDLGDCIDYKTVMKHSAKNKKIINLDQVQDDEEEVFEKDEFDDYSQTISNYLNSLENQQPVAEFDFVNPWAREPLQPMSSLDLDEYRLVTVNTINV